MDVKFVFITQDELELRSLGRDIAGKRGCVENWTAGHSNQSKFNIGFLKTFSITRFLCSGL